MPIAGQDGYIIRRHGSVGIDETRILPIQQGCRVLGGLRNPTSS